MTLALLTTLVGGAATLLMWPFPKLASQGVCVEDILRGTWLATGVCFFAALAVWLTDKRHPALWIAQVALWTVLFMAFFVGIGG